VIEALGERQRGHGAQEQDEPPRPLPGVGFVVAGMDGLERLRLIGIRHGSSSSRASGAK
jgi:hypothetical protein